MSVRREPAVFLHEFDAFPYTGSVTNTLPIYESNGFNKMLALATILRPQGGTVWKQAVSAKYKPKIGASLFGGLVGKEPNMNRFFSKMFLSSQAISTINKNWGNLSEDITRQLDEMVHQEVVFDGISFRFKHSASATVDAFSPTPDGYLKIHEYKTPITRELTNYGVIPFHYKAQVQAQLDVTGAKQSRYFESQLYPCSIQQMSSAGCTQWTSNMVEKNRHCLKPVAFGYVAIEPRFVLSHKQYCLDPSVTSTECNCEDLFEALMLPLEHCDLPPMRFGLNDLAMDLATISLKNSQFILGLPKTHDWNTRLIVKKTRDDEFFKMLRSEKACFIMCFVCSSYNTAESNSNDNIVSKHKDRLIASSAVIEDYHNIFGKNFTYPWGDAFIEFLVERFRQNLYNQSQGKPLNRITREDFKKYIDPAVLNLDTVYFKLNPIN